MSRCVARVLLSVMMIGAIPWSKSLACEVMGFSFNERVSGRHLFADFRIRGDRHADGWGGALYPDKSLQLIKEGKPATESDLAEFLTRYKGLESDILIAFLRTGSPGCGGPSHLFVYLDERDPKDLVYVRRVAPYSSVYFKHVKKEVDLSKIFAESAKGYVFATRPLTTEKWTPLPAASLMVLKKGEIVYTTPK